MENKTVTTRVIIFAIIMIAIIALMTMVVRGSSVSGKYDSLTQSLAKEGVSFFGAFWCPHCQEQESWLDASRQKLAAIGLYKECSNPDQSQTPICIANKIESYPTWVFPKGITIKSTADPLVCTISPGAPNEDPKCAQVGSQYFKRWIFPSGEIVASADEPAHTGDTWSFTPTSQLRGEITPPKLAEIAGVPLTAASQQ